MTLTRHQFIAAGAGALGASLLPPSVHTALARPIPQGGLEAIGHVVFLMQENRSFDHYFGTMKGVRGFGDRNAIELPDGGGVFEQPNDWGEAVLPFPVRDAAELVGKDLQYIDALPHGWPDGQRSRGDGWHNGWIPAKSAATMTFYDRRDIPFQYELADTFTICDHYFCSVLSSTSPNRNYHFTGYTGYEPGTRRRAIANDAYAEDTHPGYDWATYAELLEQAGVSWQVYQEWDNFTDNQLEFFASFKDIAVKALQGDHPAMVYYYDALAKASPAERERMEARLEEGVARLGDHERRLFERALRRHPTGRTAAAFRADVEAGTLPQVSYIVPSAADSEHPSVSSPIQSATITYQVLDAIASNPEVWDSTVLFINYDENDGFFDHMPPPVPPDDVAEEFYRGDPIGLGMRVPMIAISPWTVGGYVNSQVFDHTAVVRFLERRFGVTAPDISDWRRTVSGDLTSVFDFTAAGRPPRPTRPGPVPPFEGRWRPLPPREQRMPEQEPGTRPARPLPYQPDASARVVDGAVELTLRNTGSESVHFILFPYGGELPRPRHFDVSGEASERIGVGGDAYRLVLTGPNGFRREFAGSVADGASRAAEVATEIEPNARTLRLRFANRGERTLTFSLRPRAYTDRSGRTVTVAPSSQRTVVWPTRDGHGWYDLDVTLAEDEGFSRRLMGHIENGSPSITG
ncbi:phospholipase C [Nocardiopsis mwathae]|uniref:phospholipase C n=1 Tax=Nocardiopsis mwathae TaxID=1472723 RepID=A0A7X0D678_9ACTN|nr:phospholipase C, phosphocholine-specific [Nocardiopsis mwathae]MBB6172985.1 phospholipase C [Nocardiopsis mwathae]